MIKILLTPQVPNGEVMPLSLERKGEALIVNGELLDLSFMEVGDTLPPGSIDHPFLSGAEIKKTEGGIEISGVLFHICSRQTDPSSCFPDPIFADVDGAISLPSQVVPSEDLPQAPKPDPYPSSDQEKDPIEGV